MVIILDSGQCQPQFPLDTFTKVKKFEKKYHFGTRNPDQVLVPVSSFLIVVASPPSKRAKISHRHRPTFHLKPKRHLKKCILEIRCFSKFKKFWLLQNWNVLFQFQDFQREKSRLIFFSEIKGRVTMLRLFKELSS